MGCASWSSLVRASRLLLGHARSHAGVITRISIRAHYSDDIPIPLSQAFNPEFAQLLSQILYNQPQLRPAVLKALKIIVESNVSLTSDERPTWATSDTISATEASRNIEHLRGQTESWSAVLFNVFGSVGQEGKGLVGEVISAWAGVAGGKVRSGSELGYESISKTRNIAGGVKNVSEGPCTFPAKPW